MHGHFECLVPEPVHEKKVYSRISVTYPSIGIPVGRNITVVLQTIFLDDARPSQADVTLCEMVAQRRSSAVAFFPLFDNGKLVA
jgi:hypothetical protein